VAVRQGGREIQYCRGLAYTTFLVKNGNICGHGIPSLEGASLSTSISGIWLNAIRMGALFKVLWAPPKYTVFLP
jgi:hypothetical protein